MSNLKLGIVVALTFAIALATVVPIWAATYSPGVSAGQWIKYGNFVASGTGFPSDFTNQTDWVKIDVVGVSGTNVTLHLSGKYKNGTSVTVMGAIVDVAAGTMNNTSSGSFLFLIPANLQQNDAIPTSGSSFAIKVNKTESRSYLGTSRNVNVFNLTASISSVGYKWVMIWDQASGMLMELNLSFTSSFATENVSFSATDTNIFATGAGGWFADNMIYIVIAVVVIIVIVAGVAVVMMRRKPPTTTPEAKEPTAK